MVDQLHEPAEVDARVDTHAEADMAAEVIMHGEADVTAPGRAAQLARFLSRRLSYLRPNPRNGPWLVLLSGVIFSFGPLIYRRTSLYQCAGLPRQDCSQLRPSLYPANLSAHDELDGGAWRYMTWRFIALSFAGLMWLLSACPAIRQDVANKRLRRSLLGGALMAG